MKKFWTVKNGVVGTAHLSRTGVEVDFRPARRVEARGNRISVSPGQFGSIDNLIINDAKHIVTEWDDSVPLKAEHTGMRYARCHHLVGDLNGKEFDAPLYPGWVVVDEEARRLFVERRDKEEAEARRLKAEAREKEEEEAAALEKTVRSSSIVDLGLSRGRIDKLRAATETIARNVLHNAIREKYGFHQVRFFAFEVACRMLKELPEFLAAEDERRRQRKDAYMTAKKEEGK